jgi:hypothetical protein
MILHLVIGYKGCGKILYYNNILKKDSARMYNTFNNNDFKKVILSGRCYIN